LPSVSRSSAGFGEDIEPKKEHRVKGTLGVKMDLREFVDYFSELQILS
jgi:hypothetical protein